LNIQIISNKANSVPGFLPQNFITCPTKVKSALYKSLMRPTLEYACTVWAPHYHNDIQCIEAIQRRAARFVMNCYSKCQSATSMLHQLNWPTLDDRRNQLKLMMMYKILHGLMYVQHSLPLTYSNLDNTFHGHTCKFTQPATRVDCYKFSFERSARLIVIQD